VENL
jgi:alpha-glucosidase (family GH31 glycosyl hydrolase)